MIALLLAAWLSLPARTAVVEKAEPAVARLNALSAPLAAPGISASAAPSLLAPSPLAAPAPAPAPALAAPAARPAAAPAPTLSPAASLPDGAARPAAPAAAAPAPAGPLARARAVLARARTWLLPRTIPGPDAGEGYYHGTSLAALEDAAANGGALKADVTYVSNEAGFPHGYARGAARRDGTPGVVLQFAKPAVEASLVRGHYSPVASFDRGKPQQLARFFMAAADLPLTALTDASKAAVIAHYAAARDRAPRDAAAQSKLETIARALGVAVPEPRLVGTEAERLDADFAARNVWAEVAPEARAEILGLRARRLAKKELSAYVRAEADAALARILAARGAANLGFHYNLHGGVRSGYVGNGIRATMGDVALNYTTHGDTNHKVYFFRSAKVSLYDVLNERNPQQLFFPSRMGSVLNVFDLDAPKLAAARADGRIKNFGNISMDFHGMKGVPYSTYLAPPLEVFVGTGKKVGLRLSRDEETLATARYLEAALTEGGAFVPGGTPAADGAIAAGAAARADAAAAASPDVAPRFALVDGGFLYHGTTLDDLIRVVESGGALAPDVSQFSYRAKDSQGYASDRKRRLGRADNPAVLLQFPAEALAPLTSGEAFRPALAVATDRGLPPVHAAYVAATKPVPLPLMTGASKDSILAWLRARAAREPGEPRWAELRAKLERALR